MKSIDLSDLKIGTVTETEYYTESGELLVSQGVTISERHIDALKRRNITKLSFDDGQEDDEIKKLLSASFQDLGDLHIDDPESAANKGASPRPGRTAPPKALSQFTNIKDGREGLTQLVASEQAKAIDKKLDEGPSSDRPTGPALREQMSQKKPSERTDVYKTKVATSYSSALAEVERILWALADGHDVDGSTIKNIAANFVRIFITDKNILLNLSSSKHNGEDYLFHHSLNVCLISINIAAALGYSERQIVQIGMGALLHDVGMLMIPRSIRTKPDTLTPDEWYEVQKHPVLGLHLLEKVTRLPESVAYIAYQVHERENGKGYPKQRSGRFVHRFAKIVQIADMFEAISSPRPWRDARIPYKAMETVIKMTRRGLVSGDFVKAFLVYTSLFPVGSLVELSDHRIGKVIQTNGTSFAKPVVSILADAQGNHVPAKQMYQVDLSKDTDIQIVKAHGAQTLGGAVDIMAGF